MYAYVRVSVGNVDYCRSTRPETVNGYLRNAKFGAAHIIMRDKSFFTNEYLVIIIHMWKHWKHNNIVLWHLL